MTSANILIVEDERIVAKDIEERLKELEYGVSATVTSGKKAIEKAEILHPDLVLMDIRLKGDMDGIETAEAIKNRFDIPVIYLTAYADEATLERAKVTEPFGYILKPFNERDLHSTIEMALYKHKIERRLREDEEWLSTTLKSIGDGVVTTDILEKVTFMNPMAEALTGLRQGEAIGKGLTELLTICGDHGQGAEESPVQSAIRDGRTIALTNRFMVMATGGRRIPVDNTVAPIRDARGRVTGAVLVFRDVSERKHFETQLQHSQEMKVLGQLAAGVAHEVRNPLNAILAITEALFQDIGDNKEYQPYLEHIRTQVNRLSDLMKDLLAFGKPIQPSGLKSESLSAICTSTLNLWKQTALSKRHEVRFLSQIESEDVAVLADNPKLQQVFLNLLENAAHQSPEGSEIMLALLKPEGGTVQIQISDQGMGIPSDKLEMVFEPFFTTRRGGVGLGLSLVKRFVESMGGIVRIWNNDNAPGCTAEVALPIVKRGDV
jgi:two-component system, cell cycle sensor histidine kinase and response regulator CckA